MSPKFAVKYTMGIVFDQVFAMLECLALHAYMSPLSSDTDLFFNSFDHIYKRKMEYIYTSGNTTYTSENNIYIHINSNVFHRISTRR